nr:hypothetical protein B0A51_03324 [Rachicladosporium sp. CCFEE 5018]
MAPGSHGPRPTMESIRHHVSRWSQQDLSTLAKTALVRLPRAVPMNALKITSREGPQPFRLDLPSRQAGRTIPLYVFIPPTSFPSLESGNGTPEPGSFPVVMDYHGGGFYLGSCLEQAPFCARLCRELKAVVISVDYRMAPLDKFPAAIEDADDAVRALLDPTYTLGYQALREGIAEFFRAHWFAALQAKATKDERRANRVPMPPPVNITLDTTKIAFSGASSGGNIALNVGMHVPADLGFPDWPSPIPRDYAHPVPFLLLYPALDLRQLPSERTRHERMPAVKPRKPGKQSLDDHLASTYVSRELAAHGRASPGLLDIATQLHTRAKMLLILSGLDTLWEQSEAWDAKVRAEGRGADLKTMRYADWKHGWTTIPEVALSKEERRTRLEVLDECVKFTSLTWAGRDAVGVMEREDGDIVNAQGKEKVSFEKAREDQEGDEVSLDSRDGDEQGGRAENVHPVTV